MQASEAKHSTGLADPAAVRRRSVDVAPPAESTFVTRGELEKVRKEFLRVLQQQHPISTAGTSFQVSTTLAPGATTNKALPPGLLETMAELQNSIAMVSDALRSAGPEEAVELPDYSPASATAQGRPASGATHESSSNWPAAVPPGSASTSSSSDEERSHGYSSSEEEEEDDGALTRRSGDRLRSLRSKMRSKRPRMESTANLRLAPRSTLHSAASADQIPRSVSLPKLNSPGSSNPHAAPIDASLRRAASEERLPSIDDMQLHPRPSSLRSLRGGPKHSNRHSSEESRSGSAASSDQHLLPHLPRLPERAKSDPDRGTAVDQLARSIELATLHDDTGLRPRRISSDPGASEGAHHATGSNG